MIKTFCGECGTKLKNDDIFCGKCGKPANKPELRDNVNEPIATVPVATATPPETAEEKSPVQFVEKAETSPNIHNEQKSDNKNKTEQKTQPIPQTQKKVLTDAEIRKAIKQKGSFLLAIIFMILGCIGIAAAQIHAGLAILGFMFIVTGIINLFSTIKTIRRSRKYTLVLRECLQKDIRETEDGDKRYYLFFKGLEGGVGCLVASLQEAEFKKVEIGDLYFLAVSRCKDGTYDVDAHFKETEWRLKESK